MIAYTPSRSRGEAALSPHGRSPKVSASHRGTLRTHHAPECLGTVTAVDTIDVVERPDAIFVIDPKSHRCKRCGEPFIPRSRSGGSVQRFCCTGCRLDFHKERLRSQRMGLYAGRLPEPATQEPPTLFEQAERLIARLTPDERRWLIERLTTSLLVTIKPVDPVGADDLGGTPGAPNGFQALPAPPW